MMVSAKALMYFSDHQALLSWTQALQVWLNIVFVGPPSVQEIVDECEGFSASLQLASLVSVTWENPLLEISDYGCHP